MDNFRSVYEEKTGNCWTSSSFTKYPNKFYPLEIDYGQVRMSCLAFSLCVPEVTLCWSVNVYVKSCEFYV